MMIDDNVGQAKSKMDKMVRRREVLAFIVALVV
jgi:hypothetical protein